MTDEHNDNESIMPNDQPVAPTSPSVESDVIVDNRTRRVGDFLRKTIKYQSKLSVVSAYFTIYAYDNMRDVLEKAGPLRFLYGEPAAVGQPDPSGNDVKSFRLNEDGGMELKQALAQKPLAQACATWIKKQVQIRTIKQSNFLHGKLYHIERDGDSTALAGSSNFTMRGLGFGSAPNVELNLDVRSEEDRDALLEWFDTLWNDEELTEDAKNDVLAALERLSKPYSPQFVYYKTLFHVFETWLEKLGEKEALLRDIHLHDTEIWKRLYEFQREGATSAINRLLRYNGCIIADSVGLGKTWTALAVIKFFELRNERVLVLCPKRLESNWVRYTATANMVNNPFEEDRLNYIVRAHTDLSRYDGFAGNIDLARFNWSAFDLVVIDESHNFRNEGRDRKDENGNLIRRSRYNRLIEEVLKGGVHTKVLMLSATPVNISLRDLRNQIYLMTEKREDVFKQELGIGNIQSMFNVAQREFNKWQEEHPAGKKLDKSMLLERLGADFLSLLDAVSLARSREHIRRFYPEFTSEIGGFPKRAKPKNRNPQTDSEGSLSYEYLHQRIEDFNLSLYKPSQYLLDKSILVAEKDKLNFDQSDRENHLIGMMRMTLLKRLESSVEAFRLTMSRILDKIDEIDQRIENWQKLRTSGEIDVHPDWEEEDEEYSVGKGRTYQLKDLNVEQWQQDLGKDRKVLREIYREVKPISVERDAKLTELKEELQRKVKDAPFNKDGYANRKILVFTTFADTARYLYDNLEKWVREELGVEIALVTGGDNNRSSVDTTRFDQILARFAPRAQLSEINDQESTDKEIDILIATDCLSEGQNLQDCDLVVNYDIHWNPVRLMQRFGRIDRLGSRNHQVAMTNFWPTDDLEGYLNLKRRVEARMALADATATGFDDPLNPNNETKEIEKKLVQTELSFREQQLIGIRGEEIIDIEETGSGFSLNDLTLDDFVADLLHYIQQKREELEAAPFGIHAIVDSVAQKEGNNASNTIQLGVIFCLKRNGDSKARTPNRLWPYFLVYVRDDGEVRYTFKQAQQCLTLFRTLTAGKSTAADTLENAFDRETKQGENMEEYDKLLDAALKSVTRTFRKAEIAGLGSDRGSTITIKPTKTSLVQEFTLVTWLIIRRQELG